MNFTPSSPTIANASQSSKCISPSSSAPSFELAHLSDSRLYSVCQSYGEQARKWRNKFIGLLPEVFRRRLYEKKGFSFIFEFGKKLAGLSEETIRRALNLEKRFEDIPTLKKLLIEGEVSLHKLARVASIATKENQEQLAQQIQILPQSAVETLVRDYKIETSQTDSQKPLFDDKSVRAHNSENELNLSEEATEKLLALQNRGIDINTLILKMLQDREQHIAEQKQKLAKEQDEKAMKRREARAQKSSSISPPPKQSRKPPALVRRLLSEEFGTKCAIPHCQKPSKPLHHTARYALSNSHNPFYLAPLCEDHHTIAHSIDQKYLAMKKGYG